MKKVINFIVSIFPIAMPFIIGRIASKLIYILNVYTGNVVLANIIGLSIGLIVVFVLSRLYSKSINKDKEQNS